MKNGKFLILWAKIKKLEKTITVKIIDNLTSSEKTAGLSANMGRYLNGRINNLQDGALFLSAWNCITGLPEDDPRELPYDYKKGMFFIVSETAENKNVNSPNYRPSGTRYEPGVPSTEVETEEINIGDKYWFSGTGWLLIKNQTGEVAWTNIAGDDPYQNDALAGALNKKLTTDETPSTYEQAYAKDKDGNQKTIIFTRDAYANSIVQRDANNRFAVGDPINTTDVANKRYADTKSPQLIAGDGIVFTENPDGTRTIRATTIYPDTWEGLRFFAEEDEAPISYSVKGTVDTSKIQYSWNGDVWHTWFPDQEIVLNKNEYIDVRNLNDTFSVGTSNYFIFNINQKKIAASGFINSLVNFNTTIPNFCFVQLFWRCTKLTTTPKFGDWKLNTGSYARMFEGCTSLITAPELPSTNLNQYCYQRMFNGCTSLVTAPRLSATKVFSYCYSNMFVDCTSLKIKETDTEPTENLVCECIISTSYYSDLFKNTGGSFTGTPQVGKYYSWYV